MQTHRCLDCRFGEAASTVESPQAHFLVMNTPGGFERMFELSPKTPEDAVRAMQAYGMEVVGPHPRRAAAS
jgi:hypothetical protein